MTELTTSWAAGGPEALAALLLGTGVVITALVAVVEWAWHALAVSSE